MRISNWSPVSRDFIPEFFSFFEIVPDKVKKLFKPKRTQINNRGPNLYRGKNSHARISQIFFRSRETIAYKY